MQALASCTKTTSRNSDYEYVLREELKYRKNISADDWLLSIGPQIARRKAEGKRSEVLLNGFKVRNVDRKVQRSSHSRRPHRRVKGQKQPMRSSILWYSFKG